jgi:hypothetical protein
MRQFCMKYRIVFSTNCMTLWIIQLYVA